MFFIIHSDLHCGNHKLFSKDSFCLCAKFVFFFEIFEYFCQNLTQKKQSGNCLNREAEIVSSSIKKKKIDVTMASVVIYKLLQMEFSNPILIFINTLVMKKYKLPEPVIQEFSKWVINCYKSKNGQMPSLWQKTVQFFVSFYGNFMKNETKKKVLNCMSSKHKSLLAEEGKEKKKEEEKKKMEEEKEKVVVVEKDDEEMEEEGYKRLTKAEKLKKAKDAKKTKIIIK